MLTEAELKAELMHEHTARRWSHKDDGVLEFQVNGRVLSVCEACGQTFWAI